jgi:Domain of unknown function (DUF5680)
LEPLDRQLSDVLGFTPSGSISRRRSQAVFLKRDNHFCYDVGMDKSSLEKFILTARSKTYASANGKSESLLPESVQYEFSDGEYSYRDVYYIGNGIFSGLETVFFQKKPVWSMSYFGDFSKMTEEQADNMLRKALIENWETTRIYNHVEKEYPTFTYICEGSGSIDKVEGTEEIIADNEVLYNFYYAGGYIGE